MRHRNTGKPRSGFVVIPLGEKPSGDHGQPLEEQAMEIVLRLRLSIKCSLDLDNEEVSEE